MLRGLERLRVWENSWGDDSVRPLTAPAEDLGSLGSKHPYGGSKLSNSVTGDPMCLTASQGFLHEHGAQKAWGSS